MKKYAPINGRVVLSEEEIRVLREAERILSELCDFAQEYANNTTLSQELSELDGYLYEFYERLVETKGDLYFEE